MKTKERLLAVGVAISLVAMLGVQPAKAAGNVTLRMTMWSSNAGHLALFNGLAADFIKQNPEVKEIKLESLDFATYTQTLTTQIAGGKAPDLAWILEKDAQQFRQNKLLVNVGLEMKRDSAYKLSEIAPGALSLWQTKDNIYAYPFSTSPFAIFITQI